MHEPASAVAERIVNAVLDSMTDETGESGWDRALLIGAVEAALAAPSDAQPKCPKCSDTALSVECHNCGHVCGPADAQPAQDDGPAPSDFPADPDCKLCGGSGNVCEPDTDDEGNECGRNDFCSCILTKWRAAIAQPAPSGDCVVSGPRDDEPFQAIGTDNVDPVEICEVPSATFGAADLEILLQWCDRTRHTRDEDDKALRSKILRGLGR